MIALVLAPVLLGVAVYRLPPRVAQLVALAGQVVIAILAARLFQRALNGPFYEGLGGVDRPLYISLRGERTALALALVMILLSTAALVFAITEADFDNRLLLLFGVLQGLVLGILLADDVFHLFVLIEVSTLVAVLLTMFRTEFRSDYDGLYYLCVQIIGMMFFLFGVAYLYRGFGVLSVTELWDRIATAADGRELVLPIAFLATGLGVKLGFFPLHSWVPRAYGNPGAPPAALVLLSGVLATVFGFWAIRFAGVFAPALYLGPLLTGIGVATALIAAAKALLASNLYVALAFSTVSQIGLVLFAAAAARSPSASEAATFHLITHAVTKATLFIIAALLVRGAGTANPGEMRGVFARQPVLAGCWAVCLASLVGLPLLAGGASKYWLAAGLVGWRALVFWALTAATALVVVRLAACLFPARRRDRRHVLGAPTGAVAWQRAVVLTLTAIVIALGASPLAANALLGTALTFGFGSLARKALITVALLAGGALAWRLGLRRIEYLGPGRDAALSVPSACLAMAVFFMAVAAFGLVTS